MRAAPASALPPAANGRGRVMRTIFTETIADADDRLVCDSANCACVGKHDFFRSLVYAVCSPCWARKCVLDD
jgi:hypothetical protein